MKYAKEQLRAGIVLSYINMLIGNLIPVFYTPIMLSLLGQNEYGLYKLSGSVSSYLSLVSLGVGSAVTRYLIKARTEEGPDKESRVFGLFMVIFQIIAVLALLIGIVLAANLNSWYSGSLSQEELSRMKILVFLMTCNTSLNFSQSPYIAMVVTHERFIFQQLMNIAVTCVAPLLNVVMLFLGYASVGMAISSLAISVGLRAGYTIYVRKNIRIRPVYRNMPFSMLREILTFSFWVFLANIVGQLYNATDTVMMGMIPALATAGVAVYSVGAMFNSIVFSLTTGLSSLLTPKVNRLVFGGASNSELTELAIRIGRIQGHIFALVVTGFIVFGRPFIQFYAGDGYEDAYWVAICLMVPNMIPLVQSVCLTVTTAQNKHRFRSIVYLGIAVLNVIGTWFLMQSMGIVGAALMTGIALIWGQGIIMNWYYHKKIGLNMVLFWKETGKVYIIPTIMCIIALLTSNWADFYKLPVLLGGIAVYTLLFGIFSWRYMTEYEKNIIAELLYKMKNVLTRRKLT